MLAPAVKSPKECTEREINGFYRLVREGEEVDADRLLDRIRRAVALVFIYIDDDVAGVAALKNPNLGYKTRVFEKAKAQPNAADFPFEIGWVFVSEHFRGRGLSRTLIEATLCRAGEVNIFATSRTDNNWMRRTLQRHCFIETGHPYRSLRGTYDLRLYIRLAAQPGAAGDAPQERS